MNWMTPDFQDLAHSVVVSHLHYILNVKEYYNIFQFYYYPINVKGYYNIFQFYYYPIDNPKVSTKSGAFVNSSIFL